MPLHELIMMKSEQMGMAGARAAAAVRGAAWRYRVEKNRSRPAEPTFVSSFLPVHPVCCNAEEVNFATKMKKRRVGGSGTGLGSVALRSRNSLTRMR